MQHSDLPECCVSNEKPTPQNRRVGFSYVDYKCVYDILAYRMFAYYIKLFFNEER